jgi:hypothetical protein
MTDIADFAVDFGPLIVCFVVILGCAVVVTWIAAHRHAEAVQRAADESVWAKERANRFHQQ